jgi:hypothetical protein
MLLAAAPMADLPFGLDRNPQTLRLGSAVLLGTASVTVAVRRRRFLAALSLGDAALGAALTRVRPLAASLSGDGHLSPDLTAVPVPFLRLIAKPTAQRVYVAEFTIRRFR